MDQQTQTHCITALVNRANEIQGVTVTMSDGCTDSGFIKKISVDMSTGEDVLQEDRG